MHADVPWKDFYDGLAENAELLSVFSPYGAADPLWLPDPIAITALPLTAADLGKRSRSGPRIEIYRLVR